ncbi:DUF2913 family protein [Salmonella enterica subsp. diarizonae]|uniref:DUF2913 family protein n=1 Tax=Salmonella diarizonae TaxID=59204 RepID=A0A6C8Y080_SALDZ|nr:DUF2913 family protein [Salmonella enterica subsp. diarizonae]
MDLLTKNSAHLAWCALMALLMARQDGTVGTPAQENLFLTRWLATALKQRRFPRDVTPDIEWLLQQGRTLGVRAELRSKLEYLWQSCTSELDTQSDLFRLTYALERARSLAWIYRLLSDREWIGSRAVTLSARVNGIYLLHSSLDAAFDHAGHQVAPLLARITGNVAGLEKLFSSCGWQCTAVEDKGLPFLYRLQVMSC